MVEYHQKEGCSGLFFDCPYGLGTISQSFCAGSHKKSKTKEFISLHRRAACRFCPLGALHSGERTSLVSSRLFGSLNCSRCNRQSSRLVGGRICVPCYNRERENMEGLNAKGNPLKLVRHYGPVKILTVKDDSVSLVKFDRVMSRDEAVKTTLMSASESVMFGYAYTGL